MNIKEFSECVGLSAHTLRYYEKIGLLGAVSRQPNGHRCFDDRDVAWVEFIKRLKATDMPLDQIREYARLRRQGDSTLAARQRMLEAHAAALGEEIAARQRHLRHLNQKIALYRTLVEDAAKTA